MFRNVLPLSEVNLRDHSFNRRVFANVRSGFVSGNEDRGLSLGDRKNRL
jgi:hypothetical protein